MDKTYPFITYLESLRGSQDERAAFAALRRGLGRDPGAAPAMFPYIARWASEDTKPWTEATLYLIASLFAYHPKEGGAGNLGAAFKDAAQSESDPTAIERRFTALLAADTEDLHFYLRQAVSFLKSKDVAINWQQLFEDVQRWQYGQVQKQWAYKFWGRPAEKEPSNNE
ncbi:MAG: type I-E CRISPR-associated protein Cse2/CasB [Anaerolineae bacterium]|nr:type I-E CRISPR-associated protein Cse2/CasB [Anaerolineae bacterium]